MNIRNDRVMKYFNIWILGIVSYNLFGCFRRCLLLRIIADISWFGKSLLQGSYLKESAVLWALYLLLLDTFYLLEFKILCRVIIKMYSHMIKTDKEYSAVARKNIIWIIFFVFTFYDAIWQNIFEKINNSSNSNSHIEH